MGKYSIIYADPPWRYGSRGARSGRYSELDYNTMSIDDLCAMNIESISENDCVLYLWATGSFIEDALKVGKAWGFKFIRIDKVWVKTKPSGKPHAACGPWGMSDCEFILLFVKGAMCSKQIGKRNQYVSVSAPYTGKHSEKPHLFRMQIENRFPASFKKLELFARKTFNGWDAFGNEIPNSIAI